MKLTVTVMILSLVSFLLWSGLQHTIKDDLDMAYSSEGITDYVHSITYYYTVTLGRGVVHNFAFHAVPSIMDKEQFKRASCIRKGMPE